MVDSNVWYSRTLRDWIGMLSTREEPPPFFVYWSEDTLAEADYHLRREHPDWSGGTIREIRDRLSRTFEDGRVEDFTIDGTYAGRDLHDGHVHAAAIACQADLLLTENVKDFPHDDECPYEAIRPDDFLLLVDATAPALVADATVDMCRHWLMRKQDADLPKRLLKANCPQFAERVRDHIHEQSERITAAAP